jgi:hypothetical protein
MVCIIFATNLSWRFTITLSDCYCRCSLDVNRFLDSNYSTYQRFAAVVMIFYRMLDIEFNRNDQLPRSRDYLCIGILPPILGSTSNKKRVESNPSDSNNDTVHNLYIPAIYFSV